MRSEHGGAVAVWASDGMTFPADQASINQQLYRLLFGAGDPKAPPMTLGEATQRAKAATAEADVRRTWILFGDPSMRVK
ncbi:MAG TPA: C25 family cysteine peptidase [Blastocatellia bacterium]|nr:C25 family cysteine peptidase [Blastocatellia bacterium]